MKSASIRELRHDTTTVLQWVEEGESVEIRRHGKPVAVLIRPAARRRRAKRPDFMARLKSIYGPKVLSMTGTELVSQERGDR